jgi:hypothetical protein
MVEAATGCAPRQMKGTNMINRVVGSTEMVKPPMAKRPSRPGTETERQHSAANGICDVLPRKTGTDIAKEGERLRMSHTRADRLDDTDDTSFRLALRKYRQSLPEWVFDFILWVAFFLAMCGVIWLANYFGVYDAAK